MKALYSFLLVAGPFCVGSASAQGLLPPPPGLSGLPVPGWQPDSLLLPGWQLDIRKGAPFGAVLSGLDGHRIRIMGPDNMPCLIPDMRRMERMPVDRRGNTDRMANQTPNAAPIR